MSTSQTQITRQVRRWMATTGSSQTDLARLLGTHQTSISARLGGRTRWSLNDIDALADTGIITLTIEEGAA